MFRTYALLALAIGLVAGCAPPSSPVPVSSAIGGTRSLFLGERGFGQFNRDVESTTGVRIREALRTNNRLGVDILNRMAVELAMLQSAEPAADLLSATSGISGSSGRFLQAGARRYAYVLRQAADHPEANPCGYTGPLHQGNGELYDPRELCWWEVTFREAGLRPGTLASAP